MVNEVLKEPETEDSTEDELAKLVDAPVEDETSEVTEEPVTPVSTVPVEKAAVKPTKKKVSEDIVEEKTYTIPLSKALLMPPRKRAPRAMRIIRAYIAKHMKIATRAEEEDEEAPTIRLTNELNERVWGRGIEKPPRKIRVRAAKDSEGDVTVHLAEAE